VDTIQINHEVHEGHEDSKFPGTKASFPSIPSWFVTLPLVNHTYSKRAIDTLEGGISLLAYSLC
ncbi:MAG: hypothetical protein AAF702_28075, partial [Chloroflexota bacterium]